jgi:hypothetical protein
MDPSLITALVNFAQRLSGVRSSGYLRAIELPVMSPQMNPRLRQTVASLYFPWLLRASLIVLSLLFAYAQPANAAQNCEGKSFAAEGYEVVCSATWSLVGECDGNDMWARWTISGRTSSPDSFIRPWADTPIKVIGYELVRLSDSSSWAWAKSWFRWRAWLATARKFTRNSASWFMIGSTIEPDGMLWLGDGETRVSRVWPHGFGQPWPSRTDARPVAFIRDRDGKVVAANGDLLDLHGACFDPGAVTILLTIYYSPADH